MLFDASASCDKPRLQITNRSRPNGKGLGLTGPSLGPANAEPCRGIPPIPNLDVLMRLRHTLDPLICNFLKAFHGFSLIHSLVYCVPLLLKSCVIGHLLSVSDPNFEKTSSLASVCTETFNSIPSQLLFPSFPSTGTAGSKIPLASTFYVPSLIPRSLATSEPVTCVQEPRELML